jgi:hypothetical protein
MKFGASIWPFQWDPPYEDGISRIASLGFEAVELIGWDRENLHDYYTPKKVKELRRFAKLRALPRKTGAHPRGVDRSDGPSAGGGYGEGRPRFLRAPRLPWHCGPTAMTAALAVVC